MLGSQVTMVVLAATASPCSRSGAWDYGVRPGKTANAGMWETTV